jgi:hypothetical protein
MFKDTGTKHLMSIGEILSKLKRDFSFMCTDIPYLGDVMLVDAINIRLQETPRERDLRKMCTLVSRLIFSMIETSKTDS